jgi:large subunit ribosomal protein L27
MVARTDPASGWAARRAGVSAISSVTISVEIPGALADIKCLEQYVIPGNIIFRQRGTHWFAGDGCGMGRDHTIYATEHGYVKYYKDPERHPKRQYIGVVHERNMKLPLPRNAMRRRRLGMDAVPIEIDPSAKALARLHIDEGIDSEGNTTGGEAGVVKSTLRKIKERRGEEGRNLRLKQGYMYRETNWEIGRAAERAGVKVRQYRRNDRWLAWQKTVARRARVAESRGLTRGTGKAKVKK